MESVRLSNNFLSLTVLTYGAIIQELRFLYGKRHPVELVKGYSDPEEYRTDLYYLGACIGRNAGRIGGGGYTWEGTFHVLPGQNSVHLHGGPDGFHQKIWEIETLKEVDTPSVTLTCYSPNLESGYPGNLQAWVTYTLIDSTLQIEFSAETDEPGPVNLTQHAYFLLDDAPQIDHYELELLASAYLETDAQLVPTGKILPVENTPLDFRKARKIGKTSLDTPFLIDAPDQPIARIVSPQSGLRMTVTTDQPAVVVFTPPDFPGICFETQHHPNAPNHPHFPNTILYPGESYSHRTSFTFDLLP